MAADIFDKAQELRDGDIEIEDLVTWVKAQKWDPTGSTASSSTAAELHAQVEEDQFAMRPGSWDDVRMARITGLLTPDEYMILSRAMDGPTK